MTGMVKGTLLLARLGYLRSHGEETARRVLRHVCEEDRELLARELVPADWYPGQTLLRLDIAIAALLSQGDRDRLFLDMGRHSAQLGLGPGGPQRAAVREGDPQHLLRQVPRLYAAAHSAGRRTHEAAGERAAILRTFDAGDADADDCLTTVGWLQRAIELSGGRDVRVGEKQCRARGADHCEYRCEWR